MFRVIRVIRELSKSNNNSFHGITTFQLRGTSTNYSYSELIFLDRRKAENEWKKAENEWKKADNELKKTENKWKRAENKWKRSENEQQRTFDYEGGTRIISK